MNISQRFFPVLLISTVILFIWPGICLYPQSNSAIENAENRPFIILVPADSIVDGFPVLREIQDDDTIGKIVYDLAHSSYMNASIKLYHRVQNYLVNTGKQDRIEPAYLLLSQHEGGFPRHGFYLKEKGSLIDNTSVSFVELVKNNTKPENYLGSMTQIFPHEMGHVFYHLLSADSDSAVPYATDVHYSTLITDYRTAFNEGFAIHFENMARKYEPDSSRKNRILADYKLKKEKVKHRINPFIRDFKWPLRIGIYRAAMIIWYQNFEDIKRFDWVNSGQIKYRNADILSNDAEKALYFRNSGIATTNKPRSLQQMLSTEGMIANFFIRLMKSDLKYIKADPVLLRLFSEPGESDNTILAEKINPVENEYFKIFYVLHKHVNQTQTQRSQIEDFIAGYCTEFPEEADEMAQLFYQWSDHRWPIDPGPELWITNRDHPHGILVMDQFGGITLPYYTFNLNAAGVDDLMTFKEIDRNSAGTIIRYINQNGPLSSLIDLNTIEGIKPEVSSILQNNRYDPDFFKKFDENSISLTLKSLLTSGLVHLLKLFGLWYLILLLAGFALYRFLYRRYFGLKQALNVLIRFLGFFILMVVLLIFVNRPFIWFLFLGIVVLLIQFVLMRKRNNVVPFTLSTMLVIAVCAYSFF